MNFINRIFSNNSGSSSFEGGNQLDSNSSKSTTEHLTELFFETLISYGLPAICKLIIIAFTASQFRSIKNGKKKTVDSESKNPAADLYRDLYDGDDEEESGGLMSIITGLLKEGTSQDDDNEGENNRGVPAKEYITMTNVNQKFDSYEYSMKAATHSKAYAAANYRSKNFDRAMQLALQGTGVALSISAHVKTSLLQLEKDFLVEGSDLVQKIQTIQTQLTKETIDEQIDTMGMTSAFELDPSDAKEVDDSKSNKKVNAKKKKSNNAKQLIELNKNQKELMTLELNFIKNIVETFGSERATGLRTALLGDIAARGSGGLLIQLQERPLSIMLGSLDYSSSSEVTITKGSNGVNLGVGKRLFVTHFPGDMTASQVTELREEVTAIVRCAKPDDEVLVVLQSGGGTVTGYGLATAQLLRLKESGLKLTVAVEQVAASGGYMMCCVADRIVGSPFAVFGSIGVVAQMPNVYERLKTEGVEFQTITAGKYKRTLTPFKKVEPEDLKKTKEEIEEVFDLFSSFVKENRPQLNILEVATGETWFGTDALKKGLCDEIKTVDDVLLEYINDGWEVFEVKYSIPKGLGSKFGLGLGGKLGQRKAGPFAKIARLAQSGIGWLVQTVAADIRSEFVEGTDNPSSIEKRYIAKANQADYVRTQS